MFRHAVLVLFLWCLLGVLRNWDIDGRVTVLKQWDIRRSGGLLSLKHLSLHYHKNVHNVLFEILLGGGKRSSARKPPVTAWSSGSSDIAG